MDSSVTFRDRVWVKSVGDVAAPLLAGFSFTAVIVVSNDAGKFRWPGWAVLCWTLAVIALIMAVQCSKYAREKGRSKRWFTATLIFYQAGIVVLLLGLSFALAPLHGTGLQGSLQWVASAAALIACVVELVFMARRPWRESES